MLLSDAKDLTPDWVYKWLDLWEEDSDWATKQKTLYGPGAVQQFRQVASMIEEEINKRERAMNYEQ